MGSSLDHLLGWTRPIGPIDRLIMGPDPETDPILGSINPLQEMQCIRTDVLHYLSAYVLCYI